METRKVYVLSWYLIRQSQDSSENLFPKQYRYFKTRKEAGAEKLKLEEAATYLHYMDYLAIFIYPIEVE